MLPELRRPGRARKWCSETCRVTFWRDKHPSYTQERHRATFAPAPAKKWCANCGCKIANRAGIKFCTAVECRRASRREAASAHSHARRARLAAVRSERFKNIEIFERDGWICGICREAVDRTAKWPHPLSATLDHIVPLRHLGPHTRDNVQLAHWSCNARKGARLISGPQVEPLTQEVA